jgi:Raf kinase inhibitor-like YbhB/YbcL family protein
MKMTASVLFVALIIGAGSARAAMTLTSPDVKNGGTIRLTNVNTKCGGQNVSPELVWSGAPRTTQSFALTVIDLDVRPDEFSHWIIVDLPPNTATLPRGAAGLPLPAKVVANNFGETAYGGPCPPKGSGKHRYQFTIWALPSATTSIAPDEKARVVSDTLTKIAVDKASLTATYGR